MTDQDSLPAAPHVSPDGRFWWDGASWQPFVQAPEVPTVVPVVADARPTGRTAARDARRRGSRRLVYGVSAAGLAAVLGAVLLIVAHGHASTSGLAISLDTTHATCRTMGTAEPLDTFCDFTFSAHNSSSSPITVTPSDAELADSQGDHFSAQPGFSSTALTLQPGSRGTFNAHFFVQPSTVARTLTISGHDVSLNDMRVEVCPCAPLNGG